MNSDKDLFKLARHYVILIDSFEKATLYDEEFAEEMEKIRNEVLEKRYDINKFVEFQNMYREMTVAEYYEFINKLK